MIKRFFSLYRVSNLLIVLGIAYLFILIPAENDLLEGFLQNFIAIVFTTIIVLVGNAEAVITNFKWVLSGNLTDRPNTWLSKNMIQLKEARLGEDNPLFVVGEKRYFYYDNNYNSTQGK